MNITFTDKAIAKIQEKYGKASSTHLKLKYDTDGCGCVVSGVTTLWIVDEKEDDDVTIETNFVPVLVEKQSKYF